MKLNIPSLEGMIWTAGTRKQKIPEPYTIEWIPDDELVKKTQEEWLVYFVSEEVRMASAPECYQYFKELLAINREIPIEEKINEVRQLFRNKLITCTTIHPATYGILIEPTEYYDPDDHTGYDTKICVCTNQNARDYLLNFKNTQAGRKFLSTVFYTKDSAEEISSIISQISGKDLSSIGINYDGLSGPPPWPVSFWTGQGDNFATTRDLLHIGCNFEKTERGLALGVRR